jgi:hypothetical protein
MNFFPPTLLGLDRGCGRPKAGEDRGVPFPEALKAALIPKLSFPDPR